MIVRRLICMLSFGLLVFSASCQRLAEARGKVVVVLGQTPGKVRLVAETPTDIVQEKRYARVPIKVGDDGVYRFRGLPGREYSVSVLPPYDPSSVSVQLPGAGQTRDVSAVLTTFLLPTEPYSLVTKKGMEQFLCSQVQFKTISLGMYDDVLLCVDDASTRGIPTYAAGGLTLVFDGTLCYFTYNRDYQWPLLCRLTKHDESRLAGNYSSILPLPGWYPGWVRSEPSYAGSFAPSYSGIVSYSPTGGAKAQIRRYSLTRGVYALCIADSPRWSHTWMNATRMLLFEVK
jgi:hypothetical protein